jgi:ribonuclease G
VSNELIIDVSATEISIAQLEDKRLIELHSERREEGFSVGDIYIGRVRKLMPGLNAAFVDVGYEKDAFLHYLDLGPQFSSLSKFLQQSYAKKSKGNPFYSMKMDQDIDKNGKISTVINPGQNILVQIAKEPISTKGPRLTSEISIAGRNMVLLPFSEKISVSQKIGTNEEKKRLKKLLESIKPAHYGVIVRTAAEGKKVAVLDAELKELIRRWELVYEKVRTTPVPGLVVSEMDRTIAILRDILNGSFTNIYVNNQSVYEDIRDYIISIAPDKEKIVKLYKGTVPIFDQFGVAKQIKASFGKTVSFKSGAYLIIEHTEALHVIDVNSGNRSKVLDNQESNALEVNSTAVQEIARQLRLRDMGGIIVIDFIDMHSNENKQKIFDKMKEAMSTDRAKHNILPLTKFGLMQITRQRVRPEMHINTTEQCPSCQGTGQISPAIIFDTQIENRIAYFIEEQKLRWIKLIVHPYIAAFLKKGIFSKRLQWIWKYKCYIKVVESHSFSFMEHKLYDRYGSEITQETIDELHKLDEDNL